MFGIFKKIQKLESQMKSVQKQLWDIKTPFLFNIGDTVIVVGLSGWSGAIGRVSNRSRHYSCDQDELVISACNDYVILFDETVYPFSEKHLQKFNQVKPKKNGKKSP